MPPTSTSSSSTTTRRAGAARSTRASRSGSTPGSPAARPRASCSRPTWSCARAALQACWSRSSPRSSDYQASQAWVWEHQALTRARFCAGDAAVGAALRAHPQRDPHARRANPAPWRERSSPCARSCTRAHPNASGLFDLKHDRGGMIDIEFAVQYLVLAHAHAPSRTHQNLGNIALLHGRGARPDRRRRSPSAAATPTANYRRLQHALRLNGAQYARVPARAGRRRMWLRCASSGKRPPIPFLIRSPHFGRVGVELPRRSFFARRLGERA